jgi:hypothetical protein
MRVRVGVSDEKRMKRQQNMGETSRLLRGCITQVVFQGTERSRSL